MMDFLYAHPHFFNVLAAGDIATLFKNATKSVWSLGGAFVAFLGAVGIVIAVFFAFRNLVGGQNNPNKTGWGKIVALFLFSGVLLVGGIAFMKNVAEGTHKSIVDLTQGVVIVRDHVE